MESRIDSMFDAEFSFFQEQADQGYLTADEIEAAQSELQQIRGRLSKVRESEKPVPEMVQPQPEVPVQPEPERGFSKVREPLTLPGGQELTDLTPMQRRGVLELLKGSSRQPVSSVDMIQGLYGKELEGGVELNVLVGRWSVLLSSTRVRLREAGIEVINVTPKGAGVKGQRAAYYLSGLAETEEPPRIEEKKKQISPPPPRTKEETNILFTIVDWLTRSSRKIWYYSVHEGMGAHTFYHRQELKEKFVRAWERFVWEEKNLQTRKEWSLEEIKLWDNIQCLQQIMEAKSLGHIKGRATRAIEQAAKEYKRLHPELNI